MDFTNYDDNDLDELLREVLAEQERRRTVASAPARADAVAEQYLRAVGRTSGDTEWVAPTGAHDAYPEGYIVLHDGKKWSSTTPANVWEPGVSGWREVVEEDEAPPEWVAPTGAHDAYGKGDRVTFEGKVYTSLIDANVYSPADYPAGWEANGD